MRKMVPFHRMEYRLRVWRRDVRLGLCLKITPSVISLEILLGVATFEKSWSLFWMKIRSSIDCIFSIDVAHRSITTSIHINIYTVGFAENQPKLRFQFHALATSCITVFHMPSTLLKSPPIFPSNILPPPFYSLFPSDPFFLHHPLPVFLPITYHAHFTTLSLPPSPFLYSTISLSSWLSLGHYLSSTFYPLLLHRPPFDLFNLSPPLLPLSIFFTLRPSPPPPRDPAFRFISRCTPFL